MKRSIIFYFFSLLSIYVYAQAFTIEEKQHILTKDILELDDIEGIYDISYTYEGYAPLVGNFRDERAGVASIEKERDSSNKFVINYIAGRIPLFDGIEKIGESHNYILRSSTKGGDTEINNFTLTDIYYFEIEEHKSVFLPGGIGQMNKKTRFVKRFPNKDVYERTIKAANQKIEEPTKWTGSGFSLLDGYVVTNYHVIDEARNIKVYGINGDFNQGSQAKVIGVDKTNDLALLKLNTLTPSVNDVVPYSIKRPMAEVGEDIYVLGYPITQLLGNEIKLTNGIISSRSGFEGNVSNYQITAPVQPGNSGGPVFDKNGNVIGIVVAGIDNHIAQNANYAIKTSCLYNLVESVANESIFPKGKNMVGLSLSEQVKKIKEYVYYIECSSESDKSDSIESNKLHQKEVEKRKESPFIYKLFNTTIRESPKDNYQIQSILIAKEFTAVGISYDNARKRGYYDWCNIDKYTYLLVNGDRYYMTRAEGIRVAPLKTTFSERSNMIFYIYFPPIPPDSKIMDLIEPNSKCQFFGIELRP